MRGEGLPVWRWRAARACGMFTGGFVGLHVSDVATLVAGEGGAACLSLRVDACAGICYSNVLSGSPHASGLCLWLRFALTWSVGCVWTLCRIAHAAGAGAGVGSADGPSG